MSALVLFTVPSEETKIKRIAENAVMDVTLSDGLSGFRAYDLAQLGQRAIAVRIQLKNALYYFGIFGMNFNVALKLVIAITERGAAWVDTLRGLFLHALSDFLAQVLNVVTRHEDLKAVHQFGLGFGILVEHLALFSKMDFHAQVFQRHVIAEVAIQAVGLFDDDNAAIGMLLEKAHHLIKLLPACTFGRFHVHELADNLDFPLETAIFVEFDLCRDGKTFALLLTAGNSGVDDTLFHKFSVIQKCSAARKIFFLHFSHKQGEDRSAEGSFVKAAGLWRRASGRSAA